MKTINSNKKNYIFFLITIIISLSIIEIKTHSIFSVNKSEQEKRCEKVANAGEAECQAVEPADSQESCCLVTYKDKKTGESFKKCGYMENTEYGIRIYKHLYAQYKEVKILCGENYIGKFLLISFYFILLFL